MIDSGGVKSHPKDIEEIASRHPTQCARSRCSGIPHDKWGETPLAAVVLGAEAEATAEELRDWINARVAARYQRVDRVVVMPDFPRNAAGKTLKREMRLAYWEGREKVIWIFSSPRALRGRCPQSRTEGSSLPDRLRPARGLQAMTPPSV